VNFRRTTTEQPPAQPPAESEPVKPGGKGRPTPKRSDAQTKRRAAAAPAPTNRKEAARLQREAAKAARERHRQALATGDEKNYPPLHAGKERALVRDVVDSRRSIAWVGMWAFVTMFLVLLMFPTNVAVAVGVQTGFLLLAAAVIWDTLAVRRRVKQLLATQFPNGTKEPTRALVLYGISRNNQRPARRKPRPRVKVGDPV